jgi:hypothetical protein
VTPQPFSYEIPKLLQRQIRPTRGLKQTEQDAIGVSYVLLESNFSELVELVSDGYSISERPVIRVSLDQERVMAMQAEATRLTHNYLASLYSFNEHIRTLVNRVTASDIELESKHFVCTTGPRTSDYARKVTFLRGLRTDCQHGDFAGLNYQIYDQNEERILFEQVFSEHAFVDKTDLGDMGRYLNHTNPNEREYPFRFIAGFQRNEFDHFYEDCLNWFGLAE